MAKTQNTTRTSGATWLETWETNGDLIDEEALDRLGVEGLKLQAHEGKWSRYKLEQDVKQLLMDETPLVQELVAKWPKYYTDLTEWPEELLPVTKYDSKKS